MEVMISRGEDGKQPLCAKTKIDLGFDRRALVIRTSRSGTGLEAEAYVVQECGRFESRAYGRGKFADFSQRLRFRKSARDTEKAVLALHEAALASVERVKAKALAYYGQGVEGAEPALQ